MPESLALHATYSSTGIIEELTASTHTNEHRNMDWHVRGMGTEWECSLDLWKEGTTNGIVIYETTNFSWEPFMCVSELVCDSCTLVMGNARPVTVG